MKLYFPVVNTLRAFAVICVVFYHFIGHWDINVGQLFPKTSGIYQTSEFLMNALYTFFVVTGFLIPITLLKSKFELKGFGKYFIKRLIRIEIPYIGSMLLYLSIGYAFAVFNDIPLNFDFIRFGHHLTHSIAFSNYEWYNIIYWTLAIEFQFYIIIALLFPLLSHNNKFVNLTTVIVFAGSAYFLTDQRVVFYFAPIFSLGMLLFLVKTERINPVLSLSLAILFSFFSYYLHSFPIAFFGLFAYLAIQFSNYSNKISDWIGDKSYSIYLIHGAVGGNVMYFFSRHIESLPAKIGLVILAIIASGFAGYVFWRVFEKASHRWSRNFGKK